MVKEEAKNANAHAPAETACATRGGTDTGGEAARRSDEPEGRAWDHLVDEMASVGYDAAEWEAVGGLVLMAARYERESEYMLACYLDHCAPIDPAVDEAREQTMACLTRLIAEIAASVLGAPASVEASAAAARRLMGSPWDNPGPADAVWAYQLEALGGDDDGLSYDEICDICGRLRDATRETRWEQTPWSRWRQ